MPDQTKIRSIKVENVRGIASATFVFDTPEMLGNKFHLLVAPNGFGKSSLAAALDNLKPRSLKLPASLLHKDDDTNMPLLELTYSVNGTECTIKADESCNEISKVFSISVINSKLKPRASSKTGFNPHAKPVASVIIEPVVLVESIPKRPDKSFAPSTLKQSFGAAGKVLPNIQPFLENATLLNSVFSLSDIGHFDQKKVWKQIDLIVADINKQNGTVEQLVAWAEANKLVELQAIPELAAIAGLLADEASLTLTQKYLVAYQLAKAYSEDSKLLDRHREWRSYLIGKQRCEELLKSVNSNPAWISVSVRETKGQLIADFPVATKMSNGQRDLLSFVAQLMKAEFELTGVRAILVVDEVFDYLDECNLLAAQFYVTRFVERFRSNGAEIFPIFLTHLNPEVFKHTILGLGKKDIRRVHFLDKASDTSRRIGIAAMVRIRDDPALKLTLGKYFFHYHPQNSDHIALFRSKGLKETWGKSHDFYAYVFEEFRKYRLGACDADHVAACVAARIAIERHAFDGLEPAEQTRFTEEFVKGTVEKLDFAELLGCRVPDTHRLLGLLYNDILHCRENFDNISPIVSKMKNPAIPGMMSEIAIPTSF